MASHPAGSSRLSFFGQSDDSGPETDRIDAVYEFHRAFAALEAAVGRTLR